MKRVEGKVAIVTGGASGLGLAACQRLAEEGAQVVMADIAEEQGAAAAAAIDGAEFARLNVSDEQNWQALIDSVVAEFGRLDVLVNCAGVVQLASIEHTTAADTQHGAITSPFIYI